MSSTGSTRCTFVLMAVLLLSAAGAAFAQGEPEGAPPLSIQPGTVLTVRANEAISSDRSQVGDVFSATLTKPLIVQGIVVAPRGQTVGGRVIDCKRAGSFSGTSRLAVELTSITLADGQNIPIRTQLLVRNGRAATEREAGTIVGTTAIGATIGAIAGRGRGAAIGAGAGAAAGMIGVLLTRGYPTVIYPESLLTFELLTPVDIDTNYAPNAFRAVREDDYDARLQPPPPQVIEREVPERVVVERPVVVPEPVYVSPYPYVYPYPYYVYRPYPYYRYYARPHYYGPSVSFVVGPRYYGHRTHYVYAPRPFPHRPIVRERVVMRHHR